MEHFRGLLTTKDQAKINITGIAYDKGASVGQGASFAPSTIFELSKHLPPFTMDGKSIEDVGVYLNGIVTPSGNSLKDNLQQIKDYVAPLFKEDKFNIFIGGDHSASIPLEELFFDEAQSHSKTPVIIHIDAHPDFCDYYDDSYYSHACPNMRSYEYGYKLENMVLIGIRGYEKQEVDFFNNNKELKIFNSSYILEHGYEEVANYIISKYAKEDYEIYISYDIDANDPSFATGTGTPEAFGLNPYKLVKLINQLISKLNVKALDIMEVSPLIDDVNNTTSWLTLKTLYEVFYQIKERTSTK